MFIVIFDYTINLEVTGANSKQNVCFELKSTMKKPSILVHFGHEIF